VNLSMPKSFPQKEFQEFAKFAGKLFPKIFSDENLSDPLQKHMHFQRAWLAVCYRYRACSEYNASFKTILAGTNDLWREWGADEELNYKIEQCLYYFFVSGLSVFESLGFCLYFVGGMMDPNKFPMSDPRKITLKSTVSAFEATSPGSPISRNLRSLLKNSTFKQIEDIRNILAHRITGRRNVRSYGNTDSDGVYTQIREEIWHIPGSDKEFIFDEDLIQRYLDEITGLLKLLISAAMKFVKAAKND